MLISIIIPVVRPEGLHRCTKAITKCGVPDGYELEVLAELDEEGIGCPKMVKRLTDKATGTLICFLGDDTEPQPGWLHEAVKVMESFPNGIGLVGLNCGSGGPHRANHWLADRALLPHLGYEFFHTGYQHCFCDDELTQRCAEIGKYKFAEHAIVKHHNPFVDSSVKNDDFYRKAYSTDVYISDQKLFYKRKANEWK